MKTVYIVSYRLIGASLRGADVVIEPDTRSIAFANFHKAGECINLGQEATQSSIPEIKRLLFQN
jgi:hypothetical protein